MKPLTVKQLHAYLELQIKKGREDYIIFVTDDEEANGYHALWYEGMTPREISASQGKEIRKLTEESNCDLGVLTNKDKAIYLG